MQTKAPHPAELLAGRPVPPLVAVYFEMCQLKQLFRQGWLKRAIPPAQCESVAEHCFGVAVLAMLIVQEHYPELDAAKIMRLALLHDFGEIHAGDLTPEDGIGAEEKLQRERRSAERVFGGLPGGEKYLALWEESQSGQSPEARLVREVDKLEMALQAGVYEALGLADLEEFYRSAEKAVTSPALQEVLAGLMALRSGN